MLQINSKFFCALLLLFLSTPSHAGAFVDKLIADGRGSIASQEIFYSFARKYDKGDPVITDNDYKRLVQELRNIVQVFEGSGGAASSEARAQASTSIEKLGERVNTLSDAVRDGRCASLPIDLASAAVSGGDWRLVKTPDGSQIEASGYHHVQLYWFFRLGCNGEKNFNLARKVLADISDLEPKDPSKQSALRPDVRHCMAEVWARYGIGGAASEEQAQKYAKRFATAAWFPNGKDGPAERAELAKRYPDDAKNGFMCRQHNSGRIDPRNPWEDLW